MAFDPSSAQLKTQTTFDPSSAKLKDQFQQESTLTANPYKANEILDKGIGYNADAEQVNFIDGILSTNDIDLETSRAYYNNKFGENFSDIELKEQIRFEYGDKATPSFANSYNKAMRYSENVLKNFAYQLANIPAQMPQMIKEANQLMTKFEENVWRFAGVSEEGIENFKKVKDLKKENILLNPLNWSDGVVKKAEEFVPDLSVKASEFGKEQIAKSEKIQAKYQGSKTIEEAFKDGDAESIAKIIGNAIAFETPALAAQIGISLGLSPAAGIAFQAGRSATIERADLGEKTSLERKVLDPMVTATIEAVTERIGTGKILSDITKKQISNNVKKELLTAVARGSISEGTSQFGANVVDLAFGDDVDLRDGVLLSTIVGGIMDGGVSGLASMPYTLGDANRTRKQNSNEEIDAIVESNPLVDSEGKEKMSTMLKSPTPESVKEYNEYVDEQLNNLILNELDKQAPVVEPTPVAEPTEPQELKSVEQMRREIDVTEDSFADIQNNLEEDVNPVADEVNKSRSKFVNNVMTPLLSAVEDINPQVGKRLRKFEFDVHRKKRDDGREISGFLKEMTDLAKKDSYNFTQVSDMLLNGEYKKAEKVIGKENLTKVRKLMEKYADELETVGFDVSRQTDYFPRRVKDYEGLKDELGQEIADKIDDALAEQQEKAEAKGYVLSPIEESKIINNVITGAYRPVGGVKPRALKERKIEEITSDISPYYYDAQESLMMYLDEAADVIEMRKLFGKDLQLDGDIVDVNESIGAYINEISKGLEGKDRTDLISLFRTRFNYRPTSKKLQRYKTIVGLTTLGQVQNAITQMGDMTWSVYENGFANTLKAAFGDKKITTEDLGVKEVAAEFRTFDGLRGALDTVFKYSGFRKIDQLGKETLVNSTLLEYQQQAKNNKFDRKKQERLDVLFPTKEKQQEVIQQLKDGKSTEDIDFLMFSTLLDYQPVTLSNMPVKYLEMPNGRVLYTLKTFTIKQLDTYRQNGIDGIQRGIASGDKELIKRGFSDLLRLVGIFYLMNVPTDLLKDWMSGKKIYLTDTLIDNFYKLLGVSRYNVEYATRGGRKPSELLVRTVMPPFSFIDVPFGDLISIMSNLKKGEETDISKLESWRFLPFLGRTLYYTVGKGKEKEEKKAKQKEKEK